MEKKQPSGCFLSYVFFDSALTLNPAMESSICYKKATGQYLSKNGISVAFAINQESERSEN